MPRGPHREPLFTRARWTAGLALRAFGQGRFPFKSQAVIARAQGERVRSAVSHGYEHVPYYGETMRHLGLRPTDFRTGADLARLPLIEREQVQRDPEYFVSRAQPIDRYVKTRSGGSSGEPLVVFHDGSSLLQHAAYRERSLVIAMRLAGRTVRARELTVSSPLRSSASADEAFRNRVLDLFPVRVQQRHLSPLDPPARVVEAINEFRPDFVSAYGSYMEALFLHLFRTGEEFHRPKVALYGSDPLSDSVRSLMKETFGIPALSNYGAIEASYVGFECDEHAGLHLNVDIYPARIVDAEGQEVPPGESGTVVVSNLVNRGTVLLNYRLGDAATKLLTTCPCGRSLPLLALLGGPMNDWLQPATGEPVHTVVIRVLFAEEEEIWRYQVVQRSRSRLDVAVVAADDCDRSALQARLARKLAGCLGRDTTARISFVSSLPQTSFGKVRPVISMRAPDPSK